MLDTDLCNIKILYIFISAVKRLIAYKIIVFVYIIWCILCIFILYISIQTLACIYLRKYVMFIC